MAQLIARSLSFAFHDATPLLENVDLSLDRRWWAVVGENGAGKTTLLRLLSGSLRPAAGVVRREPADAVIAVVDQVVDGVPAGAASLAEDAGGSARALRDALRLDPDALDRWSTLSPGERKRWQIGAALLAEPDVLLLDEPTNHLDGTARRLLVRALRRFRGVGVVVTHDRDLMSALGTGTVRVRRGGVRATTLGWDEASAAWELEQRAAVTAREAWRTVVDRREVLLADARRHRAETQRMKSTRARMRNPGDHEARGTGPKTLAAWAEKRAGRVVGVRRAELERARAAEPEVERVRELGRSVFLSWEPSPAPRVADLEVDALRAGDREVLRDVRLTVGREDRIRLAGDNGSGKTTLLRALVGAARSTRITMVPQELDEAARQRLLHDVRRAPPAERGRVLSLLAALGSDPDRLLASASPSPGEARKLALARALGGLAHAVVLDEPSNDLDLPAVERVEAAIAAFPGAVVLVTHDERLAAALTRTTWTVAGGTVHV